MDSEFLSSSENTVRLTLPESKILQSEGNWLRAEMQKKYLSSTAGEAWVHGEINNCLWLYVMKNCTAHSDILSYSIT